MGVRVLDADQAQIILRPKALDGLIVPLNARAKHNLFCNVTENAKVHTGYLPSPHEPSGCGIKLKC
jgi:hypothetical protein